MRNERARRHSAALLEGSFASGIGQALAGWAMEYTHDLLERDPELRRRLRENWLFMFRRIADHLERPEPKRGRGRGAARR